MTVVNTNVAALSAQSSMMKNTREMENAMAKLSSGLRINTASDDAAGISIADRLESQVRGLSQAIRNSQDGQNLIDTVEGASEEMVVALQRLRELAVQAASGTNSGTDRNFLNKEAQQLIREIDRISSNTQWNNMNVLDGTFLNKSIQTGMNASNSITLGLNSTRSDDMGHYVMRGTPSRLDNSGAGVSAPAANGLTGGDIDLAGFLGTKTITTEADDTVREAAKDINNVSSETGVTAKAATNAVLKTLNAAGAITFNLGRNGLVGTGDEAGDNTALSVVKISATIADKDDLTVLRDAINEKSGTTGVTASFFEGKINEILLTDHDGDDIMIGDFSDTNGANTIVVQAMDFFGETTSAVTASTLTKGAGDSTTVRGELILTSSQAFSTDLHITADFFGATTFKQASLEYLGNIDISTFNSAQKALMVIDGAIGHINNQRSSLGAISNRLDNVINNLTNVVENTAASQSHIRDANFAQETSALTKAQILNQAATSMLAQANASKQTVLALLQN